MRGEKPPSFRARGSLAFMIGMAPLGVFAQPTESPEQPSQQGESLPRSGENSPAGEAEGADDSDAFGDLSESAARSNAEGHAQEPLVPAPSLPGLDDPPAPGAEQDRVPPAMVAVPDASPQSTASAPQDQGKMVVTGQSMPGYSVFDASSATKTDTPVMETPQSIQVVPRAVLSDQMVVDVGEVLENVSSVQAAGTNQTGLVTSFVARGFRLSPLSNFYKNGRPFIFSVPPPTEAVERLEFVKGPASVLYGQAEPGGIVNLSLKRPTRKFFVEPRVQYGQFQHFKGIVDTGGPLSKSLGYRLNASYTNARSFRQLQHVRQFVGAASLGVRFSSRWKLYLDGNYQHRKQNADSGLSVGPPRPGELYGDSVVNVPISRSLNEPWANVDVTGVELGYELQGKLGRYLKLTHSSSAQRQNNDELRADPLPISAEMPNSGFKRGDMGKLYRARNTQRLSIYSDLLAKADFDTGPFRHRVLGGLEYFRTVRGVTDYTPMYTRAQDFNVFAPKYTRAPPVGLDQDPFRLGRSTLHQFGVFLQEQLTFNEWVHLLLSGRYDRFLDRLDTSRVDHGTSSIIDQHSGAPTFRVGALVQPWEQASFFASYSQGFRPNLDPFANEQLAPQRSHQVEGGVKVSLFQGYLSGTLTGYYLTKTNVVIVNAVSQTLNIAGQRDASGLEVDLVGEVFPGLNLLVGYSLLDAEIKKGDPRDPSTPGVGQIDITGNTPPASPKHSGRVWASYRFNQAPRWLRKFRLGLGMQARGKVTGDLFNTLSHAGYVKFDAMAGWRQPIGALVLDAQVNVKNFTNARYFSSMVRNFIKPGPPLTVMGQLGLRFGSRRQ